MLTDNRRLYDIATRQQVYVEGVKVQYAREFNSVLLDVRDELNRVLRRVRYKALDGLTKLELNRLILTLRESQSRIYSAYTIQIIKQLKDFMAANLEVSRRAYVTSFIEQDSDPLVNEVISDIKAKGLLEEENRTNGLIPLFGIAAVTGDTNRIWSAVTNAPIQANGLFLVPFIKGFTVSAQASIENIIRKAWANKLSVAETLAELTGEGDEEQPQPRTSQLGKINTQASAVIATAMQHVAGLTAVAVQSVLFGRYTWYSVMDNRTTDICISRNLKTYRYGEGPLPPAHIRCRSHVAPNIGPGALIAETFYTWLLAQPPEVQEDLLTQEDFEAAQNGELRASDLDTYTVEPLTLDEFRKRIIEILSRQ